MFESPHSHINNPSSTIAICGSALVQCFGIFDGQFTGGRDWTLDRNNPDEGFDHVIKAIRSILPKSVHRVWMPIPTRANAFIASPSIFTSEVMKDGITVMGKTYADGTFVPKGDAFAITSADCPTIVAWNSQKTHLAWAHAARDSLFDRASLVEGVSSREHFSVVHSLLDAFRGQGFLPEHVHVHVVCGIRTGFYHSRQNLMHGAYNKALLKMCEQYEGAIMDDALDEIDLYAVIRGQAIERHVPEANISVDSIDTFADTDGEGHHLWASARCPTRKNYRNLVLGYHRM